MAVSKYRNENIDLMVKEQKKNILFLYIGSFFIITTGLSIGILIFMLFLENLEGFY